MDHSAGWMPHGHCFHWEPDVLWAWTVGNAGTALAYVAIPLLIAALRRDRPDLVPWWVAWSFGAFIGLCGAGHTLKVITIWLPIYRLSAWLDVATMLVSWPAAFGLWRTLQSVGSVATREQLVGAMVARGHSQADADDVWEELRASAAELRKLADSMGGDDG